MSAAFIDLTRPPLRWSVREDLKALADEPIFTSFDDFIEKQKPQVVTRTPAKTTIIAPLILDGAKREFVIKRYGCPHWYVKLRSWFRRTVAVKELRLGLEIERRGIPVSVPAAIAERRSLGMTTECFVVIERLPGRIDLEDYLLHPEAAKGRLKERRQVIRGLADLMKRLHENGIFQYDCNLCNFLLEPETLALTFIDLAKVSISPSLPRGKRVENFAKLIRHRLRIPATDAARFLANYAGAGRANREERHRLAAEVSAANIGLLKRLFEKEAAECLRAGRNFQSLECAECSAVLRRKDHSVYTEQFLMRLLLGAREAMQAGGRHGAAFRFDLGRGAETVWAYEGRYVDLEFTWRERNGMHPAGAWELRPLALCKLKHPPERGMLFMVPSKEHESKKPFLELTQAERRLLEEISRGVEGFEQE